MTTFAIFRNVQRGIKFERKYIAFCNSDCNLSRLVSDNSRGGKYVGVGVADFLRKDGTHAPRQYVHFSRDKASLAALKELSLPCVDVDNFGNCNIQI